MIRGRFLHLPQEIMGVDGSLWSAFVGFDPDFFLMDNVWPWPYFLKKTPAHEKPEFFIFVCGHVFLS